MKERSEAKKAKASFWCKVSAVPQVALFRWFAIVRDIWHLSISLSVCLHVNVCTRVPAIQRHKQLLIRLTPRFRSGGGTCLLEILKCKRERASTQRCASCCLMNVSEPESRPRWPAGATRSYSYSQYISSPKPWSSIFLLRRSTMPSSPFFTAISSGISPSGVSCRANDRWSPP